jgi:5-methyltetrahydropteroyltriglutamate--homocysteine methyltransferase
VEVFAPGIYARSEALVQATRDLDRKRTTPEAVDAQFAHDLAELVSVQQQAGLDLLSDGMLRWQDLFRPLLEASDGLEPGALTRFLDTNTFYRAPHATTGEPKLTKPVGEPEIAPLPRPRLVTLPAPYALARGTGIPPAAMARQILKPQLDALDADLVVLSEPFLARDESASMQDVSEALEALGDSHRLALWITFADARPLLENGLTELPVDAIGIDFHATRVTDVPEGVDKLLLAGVADARNSLVEDAGEIAAFARRLREERGVEQLALVPNGDLQYVSEPIARRKLTALGRAKTATPQEAAA